MRLIIAVIGLVLAGCQVKEDHSNGYDYLEVVTCDDGTRYERKIPKGNANISGPYEGRMSIAHDDGRTYKAPSIECRVQQFDLPEGK